MSDPENIQQFRRCVGVVLSKLYDNFPCPIDIDVYYIEGNPRLGTALVNYDDEMKSWNTPGNTIEGNPIKAELLVYKNSIYFLLGEGYVHVSETPVHGQTQRRFCGVTLTSKGLAALGQHDPVDQAPIGNALHAAIRDGKYALLPGLITKLLAIGL